MLQTDIGASTKVKRARARKKRPQARPVAPAGLCVTCLHAPLCTYPRRDGRHVLQCAEFEGESLHAAPIHAAAQRADEARRERPLGLCANCALHEGCEFPKAQGGVWQCDEYR